MTKDKVLAILARKNDYISGEEISNMIGLSRAAVNAAVKALRSDGYDIDSVTNKGYMLKGGPDLMSAGAVGAYLDPERMDHVLILEKTNSTNKLLREMAFECSPGCQVVIANEQDAGRGRMGRNFFSPKDNGIYLSYLMRPDVPPQDAATLTAWTAVAMVRAIENVSGFRPSIKWVNDLMHRGHKLCGILTEMSIESETGRIDSIIIGIGINVNNEASEFPEDIKDIATSIFLETGKKSSRSLLAASMIKELDKLASDWPEARDEYLESYRNSNITCGREVSVISGGKVRPAETIMINDDFSLKVKYQDGTYDDLASGEVSLKL